MCEVILFGAEILAREGEEAALTMDAQRLVARLPSLFSPIRPNSNAERETPLVQTPPQRPQPRHASRPR